MRSGSTRSNPAHTIKTLTNRDARPQVRKALPERLRHGVTFTIPEAPEAVETHCDASLQVTPTNLFAVMDELARQAEGYRRHGGMHSAAVADGGAILLHAEDIGRHNTIDRLAGEALFQGVDLSGKVLVTSGRVSSEMAAKAALLGVALIASRTSPIDMAVKICRSAGIALVGYLRGEIHPLCPSGATLRAVRKISGYFTKFRAREG